VRAFIWDDGHALAPLGDPVRDVPILNRPLSWHQAQALGPEPPVRVTQLAEIPADAREYVLVRGHVFLTSRIVAQFVAAARASGAATCVLALEPCTFARSTTALGDVRRVGERWVYDVYFRAGPGAVSEADLASATLVGLTIKEHPIQNEALSRRGLTVTDMDVALTTAAVMHIRHWSHLTVVNYVALFSFWFDLTPRKVARYLWAVVRAGWPSEARVLAKLSVRGRKCRVHPSAVVEASVLGDRVEIAPGAVVRGCIIGDDAKIDTHTMVNYSSIGEGAIVSFMTACNLNVLYPRSMISTIGTQLAVFGRGSTLLGGAQAMDLRDPFLKQDIVVEVAGERVSSGRRLLGPCLGHEAVVGCGVTMAPGVAVPNGALIVTDPDRVVRRIDAALPPQQPHYAVSGRATPVRRPPR
jgi:carbonic anhydrase/acetyltransferase-like protein (isoleucine patch superfamily)